MERYKVARPNGRWKYGFDSLESAARYAGGIHRATGVFVAIETYKPRHARILQEGIPR